MSKCKGRVGKYQTVTGRVDRISAVLDHQGDDQNSVSRMASKFVVDCKAYAHVIHMAIGGITYVDTQMKC